MSEYTKRLHKFINGYEFVRCFYGECPDCGKHVFSIGDDAIGSKIKAKFICDCGKKWIETVYSAERNKYKYPQALCKEIYDKKLGDIKVLEFKGRHYLVTPEKIRSRTI